MITIERIKNIADDIIESNEEWVNDSHSASEYEGMVNALHMLIEHLEEVENESSSTLWWNELRTDCPR